jgi:hypothetical protein
LRNGPNREQGTRLDSDLLFLRVPFGPFRYEISQQSRPGDAAGLSCPTTGASGAVSMSGTPPGGMRGSARSRDPRARVGWPFAAFRAVQQGSRRSVSAAAGASRDTQDRLPAAKGSASATGAAYEPSGGRLDAGRRRGRRRHYGGLPRSDEGVRGLRRWRPSHLRCRLGGQRARRRVPASARIWRRPLASAACRTQRRIVTPQACGPRPFEENMMARYAERAVRDPGGCRPVRAPRATAAAAPMEVSDDEKQAR